MPQIKTARRRRVVALGGNVLVPLLVAILTVPVLTRLLAPSDYGTYVVAVAVSTALGTLSYGWQSAALARLLPSASNQHANEIVGGAWTIAVRTMLGLVVVGIFVAATARGPWGWGVFLAAAGVPLNLAMSIQRARSNMRAYTRMNLLQAATMGVSPVITAVFVPTASDVLLATTVSLALVSAAVYVRYAAPVPAAGQGAMTSDYLRFGIPFTASTLGLVLLAVGDRILVGVLRGEFSAGVYAAHFALFFRPLSLVATVIQHLLAFEMSLLYDRGGTIGRRDAERMARKSVATLGTLCAVLAAALLLNPRMFVWVLGTEFRDVPASLPLAAVVCGGAYACYAVAAQVLALTKDSRALGVIVLVCAATSLAVMALVLVVGGSLAQVAAVCAAGYAVAATAAILRYGSNVRRP